MARGMSSENGRAAPQFAIVVQESGRAFDAFAGSIRFRRR
jgi:hypothetical protein